MAEKTKKGRVKRPEQYKRTDYAANGAIEIATDYVLGADGQTWKPYNLIRVKNAAKPINGEDAVASLMKLAGKRVGSTLALGLNARAKMQAAGNKKAAVLQARAGVAKQAAAEIAKLSPEVQAFIASKLKSEEKRISKAQAKMDGETE